MTKISIKEKTDISIVLCGQAGQGIQTVEKLLTRISKTAGYNVFATKEYMSRVRGGMNSTLIRISNKPVKAFVDRIDILVPLSKGAIRHLEKRINPKTIIVGEKDVYADELKDKVQLFDIPFTKIASDIGNKVYSNTVAVGALISVVSIKPKEVIDFLKQFFEGKPQEVVEKNIEALKKGYEKANKFSKPNSVNIKITNDIKLKNPESPNTG